MENGDGSRSRSRSRDRRSTHESEDGQNIEAESRRDIRDDVRVEARSSGGGGGDGGNNLYITNLSFQTTEESLRAFFEVLGEVNNASIVKEPVTQSSRGFGFVSFADYINSERAVAELNGKELDTRNIRVEKARRASGYDKTPGRYLGPPQVSSKFASSRDGPRGGGGGGDRMGGGGGRYDNRAPAYDSRAPAYDRGGYQGGGSRDDRGGGGYGGGSGYDRAPPMYRDDRIGGGREIPRYERGRSPPAAAYYDERRGGGAYDERRGGSVGGRSVRDDYPPQSYRPREERSRGPGPASGGGNGQERGGSYGSYGGSYDTRAPVSSGGYEARGGGGGGYESRGNAPPPRGRY